MQKGRNQSNQINKFYVKGKIETCSSTETEALQWLPSRCGDGFLLGSAKGSTTATAMSGGTAVLGGEQER